ncbi:MAG: hypothetical protein ACRC1R_11790 [Cetobacterium sp.]|uniref:hypothetical protein n=1 Tax=Cetobacterium sp. TaxID=2071632 RepID=UPI003F3E15B8
MIIFNVIDYSKGKVCSLNFKYQTNKTFLISTPGKEGVIFDYTLVDAPNVLTNLLNEMFYSSFYWKNISIKLVELFREDERDKSLIKVKELEKIINSYNKSLDSWLKE